MSDSEPLIRLRRSDLAARSFDEETIVLDLRQSTYLASNPSGTVLWRLLEQGTTRSAMISALLEAFDVRPDRAAADVDDFVAECRRRSLLL